MTEDSKLKEHRVKEHPNIIDCKACGEKLKKDGILRFLWNHILKQKFILVKCVAMSSKQNGD